jgi:hypothetical protein
MELHDPIWDDEDRSFAVSAALGRHPEAEPFADMLAGDTPAEVIASAAKVAERIKGGSNKPAESAQEAPGRPETPEPKAKSVDERFEDWKAMPRTAERDRLLQGILGDVMREAYGSGN